MAESSSRISLGSARAGFLAVVVLLSGSAAFSLWNEFRDKFWWGKDFPGSG